MRKVAPTCTCLYGKNVTRKRLAILESDSGKLLFDLFFPLAEQKPTFYMEPTLATPDTRDRLQPFFWWYNVMEIQCRQLCGKPFIGPQN